ncbi:MAG: Ribokinase [Cohnella sp.]|nr:Ribokinase [Cohnella sp.]
MITVLGSMNLDVVAMTDRYPAHGETKFGHGVEMLSGGKGANQATACGKLGKDVALIGCVGRDASGERLLQSLRKNGVNTEYIKITEQATTGTVVITVDDTAENTMIVIRGANDRITKPDIDACMERIGQSRILLVQMEVPHDVAVYAMQQARKRGVYVILDPAPAEGVTIGMLTHADLSTPNKQETRHFTGIDVTDEQSALAAAKLLEQLGVNNSIIKMGEQGSLLYTGGTYTRIQGLPVEAVDTVGAGDSFAGALAAALDDGAQIKEAAEFATAVSALKVTKVGAQNGIPTLEELNAFCRQRGLTLYHMAGK